MSAATFDVLAMLLSFIVVGLIIAGFERIDRALPDDLDPDSEEIKP